MKKHQVIILFTLNLLTMQAVAQQTKWIIDPAHSSVSFSISHFMIANVKGSFDRFSGEIVSDGDSFEDAQVTLNIESASINTNQVDRDNHLRSPEFFGVEENPDIKFVSNLFRKTSDKQYNVEGELTMNGVTKPVTLTALFKGTFEHPQYQKTIGVFEIAGKIPRFDYGIGKDYPSAALGEAVELTSIVEMIKKWYELIRSQIFKRRCPRRRATSSVHDRTSDAVVASSSTPHRQKIT